MSPLHYLYSCMCDSSCSVCNVVYVLCEQAFVYVGDCVEVHQVQLVVVYQMQQNEKRSLVVKFMLG